MNKFIYFILSLAFLITSVDVVKAGNPDRQGAAGSLQVLLNPWARSAGLHTMTTSMISGVESLQLNVAGISRITGKTEILAAHTRYLVGTDINFNAFGLARKSGKSGAFAFSIMAIDMGEIQVTTTDQPEGTGATYSPSLFNLSLGYSHMFENKISVGLGIRMISESTAEVKAFALGIDAGVQYVTGPQDNFKFGISLRNIGGSASFGGQGLSEIAPNPDDDGYRLTYFQRANKFELPSLLNIGLSYDFIVNPKNRVTLLGNFTSNSFSRDNVGAGVEYAFNDMFMLRGAYRLELGTLAADFVEKPIYSGLSAGISFLVPMKKGSERKLGIDYAFRMSQPFGGTHNFAIKIAL